MRLQPGGGERTREGLKEALGERANEKCANCFIARLIKCKVPFTALLIVMENAQQRLIDSRSAPDCPAIAREESENTPITTSSQAIFQPRQPLGQWAAERQLLIPAILSAEFPGTRRSSSA